MRSDTVPYRYLCVRYFSALALPAQRLNGQISSLPLRAHTWPPTSSARRARRRPRPPPSRAFPPRSAASNRRSTRRSSWASLTYQTKRAKEICEWVNTKILNQDGQRIFFFRGETEEWSNVSLLSTDAAPLLTADPVYTIEKTVDVLTACPAVSKVTITDVHGRELTLAEVRARPLESHSRLLPSCPDCVSLLSHVSRPRRWNSARSTATRRL